MAGGSLPAAKSARLRLGITDWNLHLTSKLEAVALAKKLGFDGVQISLGMKPVDGKLRLDNGALQARYVNEWTDFNGDGYGVLFETAPLTPAFGSGFCGSYPMVLSGAAGLVGSSGRSRLLGF